jgi:hypothetical protein
MIFFVFGFFFDLDFNRELVFERKGGEWVVGVYKKVKRWGPGERDGALGFGFWICKFWDFVLNFVPSLFAFFFSRSSLHIPCMFFCS